MIKGRWKGGFDKLLDEENHKSVFVDEVPNDGLTHGISRNEVKVTLSGTKNGETTGMYGLPVEVWMCSGEEVIGMLCRVYLSRRIVSMKWRGAVIVSIYKEK